MKVTYLGPGYQGSQYIGEEYKVDGNTFYVYFPNNVNDNSSINATLYYPGNTNYSSKNEGISLTNMYNQNDNIDYAFISFSSTSNSSYNVEQRNDAVNTLIDYISDPNNNSPHHYDISINDVSGISLGGCKSTNHFLTLLRNEYSTNNEVDQKKLILYDVYGYGTSERPTYEPTFSNEDIKLLEQNKSQLVFFTTDNRLNKSTNSNINPLKYSNNFLNTLAKSDVLHPIVVSSNIEHSDMTRVTNDTGWKLYLDGIINIEDIKNNVEYIDSTTGQKRKQEYNITIPTKDNSGNIIWRQYSLADLIEAKTTQGYNNSEILAALDYVESTVIKADFDYIENANSLINDINIINQLKKQAISFSSTSELLPKESTILNNIYAALEKLNLAFIGEVKNLLYAGNENHSLDQELTLEEEKLEQILSEDIQKYKVSFTPLDTDKEEEVILYTINDFNGLLNKSVYDRANLTADDINMLIESELNNPRYTNKASSLRGTGATWIKAAEETGLDPLFLLAIARHESGMGTSDYSLKLNDHFGIKYQNGVQYFGLNKATGQYVNKIYADTSEEGILKAAHWIKDFYVEYWNGKTTAGFVRTGYSGDGGDIVFRNELVGIMQRMKDTYESTTGKTLEFIANNGTVPEPTWTPSSGSSAYASSNTYASSYAYTSSGSYTSSSSTPAASVDPTPTPTQQTSTENQTIAPPPAEIQIKDIEGNKIAEQLNATEEVQAKTNVDILKETDTNNQMKNEATITSVDQNKISNTKAQSTNSNNNGNKTLNTIGILTSLGAATAAGIYGAKKIKEKKEDNDEI